MNIESLLKLDGKELQNYIISLDKQSKGIILKDNRIHSKFMEEENHHPFVWLVQELSDEEVLLICDKELIPLLKSNKKISDKLNAMITCGNPYINSFLKDSEIIDLIIKHFTLLDGYLYNLSIDFASSFLNIILNNHPDKISYLSSLNTDVQMELFKNEDIVTRLIDMENSKEFIRLLSNKVLEKFLIIPKVQNIFLSFYIEDINKRMDGKEPLTIPENIINNPEFINKYLSVSNISNYRLYIENLKRSNINAAEKIDQERKKIYKKYFDTDEFSKLSEIEQLEMTVDMYFEDVTFNFLKIMRTMLSFNDSINKSLIPEDRLNIYIALDKYDSLSLEERKKFFDLLSDHNDLVSQFYDDFRLCQNESYQMLNDKILNEDKLLPLLNKELTETHGVPIYELKGEEFYSLINVTANSRFSNNFNKRSKYPSTTSMSLINHNHIGTFSTMDENITLGFYYVNPGLIMHMYHSDSATSRISKSNYLTKLYTPDNLISKTKGYNEILYLNSESIMDKSMFSNSGIDGDYIIASDTILSGDIAYAKTYGIPIVLMHTMHYKTNKEFSGYDYFDKEYTEYGYLSGDYHKKR